MSNDKSQVLGQIRISLKTAHLPAARANVPPRAVVGQGDPFVLAERFQRELEPLGGLAYVVQTEREAVELVLKLLGDVGGRELLTWDDSEIPLSGLGAALHALGYTRLSPLLPEDRHGRKQKLAELEKAAAGITGALAGIADTGTLALVTGPGRPRLASLLPQVHIAILPVGRLTPNLAAFFAAHPHVTQEGSNLVLVTGPSRTADIELTLQRGVHGPKFVHVVLIASP